MEHQANAAMIETVTSTIEVSNIVKFPRAKRPNDEPPMSLEEAQTKLIEARTYYSEEVSDEALAGVMQIFQSFGFFTSQDKMHSKDMVAVSELFTSMLLRQYGIHHPMQDVVDQAIVIGEDILRIANDDYEDDDLNE